MASLVLANSCRTFGSSVQSRPQPGIENRSPCCLPVLPKRLSLKLAASGSKCRTFAPVSRHRRVEPVWRYGRKSSVCLLGGKDTSEGDNEVMSFPPQSFPKHQRSSIVVVAVNSNMPLFVNFQRGTFCVREC